MIQPVCAFSPRAGFRGHGVQSARTPQERSRAQVALMNATGTSLLAGAITTIAARSYTSSWGHSLLLGVCGSVLSMFFLAPLLVEHTSLIGSKKKRSANSAIGRESALKTSVVKESIRPPKKLVQFRQS